MNGKFRAVAMTLALAAALAAVAEDEAVADEDALPVVEAPKPAPKPEKFFYALPRCKRVEGTAEVRKPGSEAWEAMEEGRYYPLGSYFRTAGTGAKLIVAFGKECLVTIDGVASFGTRPQPLEVQSRTVVLAAGEILVSLPRKLPEGLFAVATPCFSVINPLGESRYSYAVEPDGDTTVIRCVTGQLAVDGRHFKIPQMLPADEVRIRSTHDFLFTGIYGTSGNYIVELDQGLVTQHDFDTNTERIMPKTLKWNMTPSTAVRIHRAVPAVGERMSVSVMTFLSDGSLKNRCTFAEGRAELNTGEQGPVTEKEKADIAKKAAEATDTVAAPETVLEDADSSDKADDTAKPAEAETPAE